MSRPLCDPKKMLRLCAFCGRLHSLFSVQADRLLGESIDQPPMNELAGSQICACGHITALIANDANSVADMSRLPGSPSFRALYCSSHVRCRSTADIGENAFDAMGPATD